MKARKAPRGDPVSVPDSGAPVIDRFIASVLHWAEQGLRIRQLSPCSEQDSTRLLVQEAPRTRMAIRLRHPDWCRQATVKVNGRRHSQSLQPGAFIEIERTWRRGDEIVLQLAVRTEPRAEMPRPALDGGKLELIPFHRMAHERCNLYGQLDA